MREFEVPGSPPGSFGIETDLWTGKKNLVFSSEFLAGAPDETVLMVVNWFRDDLEDFEAWFDRKIHKSTQSDQQTRTLGERGQKDRGGYVYLLQSGDAFKIGRAKEASTRLAQISPLMPHPVEVLCLIKTDDCIQMEMRLHERFSSKRMNGEWFALTESDVQYIQRLPQPNRVEEDA